jgi:cation transporter-like permease
MELGPVVKETLWNKNIISILRQTFLAVMISASISMIGGISLTAVQDKLILLLPLLIIIPGLNSMMGGFVDVIASKFTTMLYLGEFKEDKWWKSDNFKKLFNKIMVTAFVSSLYLAIFSFAVAILKGFRFEPKLFIEICGMVVITTLIVLIMMLFLSIALGLFVYHRKQDPDNYLIAIMTSVSDVVTIVFLSLMLHFFF